MVTGIVSQQTKIRKIVHQDKLSLLGIAFIYTFTNVFYRFKKFKFLFDYYFTSYFRTITFLDSVTLVIKTNKGKFALIVDLSSSNISSSI